MKKIILSIGIVGLLASCGGSSELCECHEMQLEAAKEYKEIDGNEEKLKAFQEKYKDQQEKCAKIVKDLSDEMKDLTDEEKKEKQKEHEENCPAFAELQKMKGM